MKQAAEEAAAEAEEEDSNVIEIDATATNEPFPSTHNHLSSSGVAANSRGRSRRPAKAQPSEPNLFSQLDGKPPWMIPAIWSACLAVMIVLGVVSASNATYAFPICQQSTADVNSCNLAVQIIGDEIYMEEVIEQLESAPDMTSESKSIAVEDCRRFATELADGFSSDTDAAMPDVIASQSTEIFHGMLLTDVTQPSAIDGTPVRAACAHHAVQIDQEVWDEYRSFESVDSSGAAEGTGGGVWPQLMGGDAIPTDWPEVPYEAELSADFSAAKALGIYNVFITFGADTLFTAIGMLIVVFMGLAFSCYTLQGVYKAAFVAGIAGSVLSLVPAFGFFAAIAKQVLAIGIASAVVPEFKIDWSCGYYYVAIATIIVGVVRALLNMLLFGAIAAIVFR